MTAPVLVDPAQAHELALWFVEQMRAPHLRTMRQFAEDEVVIPDGPYAGRRYRCDRQPFAGLYFDAVDSRLWKRYAAVGPTQTGKTLTCCVIPLMYHLFEVGETVVYGVPDLNMVGDKWRQDILPVIAASRYRDLLPVKGSGSRGGSVGLSVTFRNGATLRFMTGGGGDKSRAGFTARVLIITETDGMDESGMASREADKISQLEGRLRANDDNISVYLECTASTSDGRIWREYKGGTESRIMQHCPECGEYVCLGREHLVGWQECDDEIAVRDESCYACPACGSPWTETQRRQAALESVLIHKGQTIAADRTITGPLPRTRTLGFRWSAPDNLFNSAGTVGFDEWKASIDEDEENVEKKLCQFVWAMPYDPDIKPMAKLEAAAIISRTRPERRGRVPQTATGITVAMDLGKYLAHWGAVAWLPDDTPHVLDYSRIEVAADALGEENALRVALSEFRDVVTLGWSGAPVDVVFVDSGWHAEIVYEFCRDSGDLWMPAKGFGASQTMAGVYRSPMKRNKATPYVGEGMHISRIPAQRTKLACLNADYWKSWLHACIETPFDQPGAFSLFSVNKKTEHLAIAKHITAERQMQEFAAGKGEVLTWDQIRKDNHWLDVLYMCCAARQYGEWRKKWGRSTGNPRESGNNPKRRNGRVLS